MPAASPRHPYEHTMRLLELSLERLPPYFPEQQRTMFLARLEQFKKSAKVPYGDLLRTIVELGKASWALRRAYDAIYAKYGMASEEALLLKNLDDGVRQKFETFITEGGKLDYVARAKSAEELRSPSPFEQYFTPEEKFAIEEALLNAKEQARWEINNLCVAEKRPEYQELVAQYQKSQQRVEALIEELRQLAKAGGRWEREILGQVRAFEEGWSVLERGVDEVRVSQELEYWKGTIEAFLNA
jgi:hypothetical protein